ncbi:hypothetical protein LPTSP4_20980 [Leptospira ryugenii]|uniref:Uncharacterized protein n=1 Tax=Leptospira ryugenii TaxID=1917863 RepID=A0A2P2E125_9LEPT|nr:hypothetical protein [Leptospira ryugenii]GBF50572.1 hypothetical protein LPTSP4_20980 [Leptospira ryugenii]
MDPFSFEETERWQELTERLFQKVQELEDLMVQVRNDLDAYRVVREEWQKYHEEWKAARQVS